MVPLPMNTTSDMPFTQNPTDNSLNHITSNLALTTPTNSSFSPSFPTVSNNEPTEQLIRYCYPISGPPLLYVEATSSAVETAFAPPTHLPFRSGQPTAFDCVTYPQGYDSPSATTGDESWIHNTQIDWSSILSSGDFPLYDELSNDGTSELVDSQSNLSGEDFSTNESLFHQFYVQKSDHESKVCASSTPSNYSANTGQTRKYKIKGSKTKYSKGKPEGMYHTWTLADQVKKPKTAEAKEKTAYNRRLKACPYHKRMRKACDPSFMPYIRCITSLLPTFMTKIEEIRLFRHRPNVGHPLESTRTELFELKELQGSESWRYGVTPITISQDLGLELNVFVSPFMPDSGDKISHIWYDGNKKVELPMLPYCLADLPRVRRELLQYIGSSVGIYLRNVIQNTDEITRSVLLQAHQYALHTTSSLVQGALHLLAVNRMIEYDWHITGPEKLGHNINIEKPSCPWFGKVPVTPLMDVQLDQIITQDFLEPLRTSVLSELQEKLHSAPEKHLYEIFLTAFILATNTHLLLQHSRRNAIRYRAKKRYNSPKLAQEYIHSHNILLSHIHYSYAGSPLKSGNSSSSSDVAHPDQTAAIQQIRSSILEQNVRDLRASQMYETQLYWSHQLFLETWLPESEEIAEVQDF
jgi:hypothetical protein